MVEIDEFEQFMKSHQGLVFSIAVRLLGDEPDANDISQEVFLKAYDHFATLRANPAAPGWLRTVTTNFCLNHLTRYRARWRFFSELFQPDTGTGWESLLPDPISQTETDEQEHRRYYLEMALRKLPDAQRVPLVLYHFEEMSYEEIARRLGISLSKVKTDIHRARESLRRWLRPELGHGKKAAAPPTPAGDDKGSNRQNRPPWACWAAPFPSALALLGGVKAR